MKMGAGPRGMTPERWRQIRDLLDSLLQLTPPERSAFLDRNCSGDPSLREELERFLTAERELPPSFPGAVLVAPPFVSSDGGSVLAAGTRLGPYALETLLGAGGMGQVYRARDTRLDRTVAIKVIPPSLSSDPVRRQRFQREARAIALLQHPNICTLYDVGFQDGTDYLVMEYLNGETLASRLLRGALPLDETLRYGIEIADALGAAHRRGIVHCDLKPGNIFLTTHGASKVLDFGLAKLDALHFADTPTERTGWSEWQMSPGRPAGTIPYMSPEQARGEKVDRRSDLFSFGTVLHEMATGSLAFSGETSGFVFDAVPNRTPVLACEAAPPVPVRLRQIVERALEKDPSRRYASASLVSLELRRLKQDMELQKVASEWGSNKPTLPQFLDSIVVLPFDNTGGEPALEYLGEGIAEAIINNLSNLRKLRVVPRTTAFRYKKMGTDPALVGRHLGARVVLTGRVIQRAGHIVVSAELIDSAQNAQLWGKTYNRDPSDVFRIEQAVAREIVRKLRLRLSNAENQLLTKQHTDNPEAYNLCLQAWYYSNKWTQEGLLKGIEFASRAIEHDPAYAAPYAMLAYVYSMLGYFGIFQQETLRRAKAAALKALEIDETLAAAHFSLGLVRLLYEWDWPGAEAEILYGIDKAPGHPLGHLAYGVWLGAATRVEESQAQLELALSLDPLSSVVAHFLAVCFYWTRQYDRALKQLRAMLDLDPSLLGGQRLLALVLARLGHDDDAHAQAQRCLHLSGSDYQSLVHLGIVEAITGRSHEARRIAEELQGERWGQAWIYGALGDREQALRYLEEAYRQHACALLFHVSAPEFESLHGDPRFDDLVRRIGLPPRSTMRAAEEGCD
jgi:serine/threonine protein kinase/Tfp pilus assembly protein PilF